MEQIPAAEINTRICER